MKKIKDVLGNEIKNGDVVVTILKGRKGSQRTLGLAEVIELGNVRGTTGWTLKPLSVEHELAYSRYTSKHIIGYDLKHNVAQGSDALTCKACINCKHLKSDYWCNHQNNIGEIISEPKSFGCMDFEEKVVMNKTVKNLDYAGETKHE